MRKSCDVIRQVSRSPSSVVESERAEGAAAILATDQSGSSHLASYGKGHPGMLFMQRSSLGCQIFVQSESL